MRNRVAGLVLIALGIVLIALSTAVSQAAAQAPTAEKPSQLVMETMSRVQNGDLAGAIAHLEEAKKTADLADPERALLGALYLEAGRPAEALTELAPLGQDSATSDAAVLYNLGRANYELQDFDQAERYLEQAVAKTTATPAIRLLGFMRLQEGKIEEAFGLLVAWSGMDPVDHEAVTTAAYLALELSRLDVAEGLLADLPANDPRVGYLTGRLLMARGQTARAEARLQPFVSFILNPPEGGGELEPGLAVDILVEYARASLAVDGGGEAVTALEKATQMRPGYQASWQLLGQALVAAGRHDEAQAALRKAQELAEQEVSGALPP